MPSVSASTVETVLRDELARADRALSGVAPVLGHMLASSGHSLVSDAIVARVRGILSDLARQLLSRLAEHDSSSGFDPADRLADQLADDAQVLLHIHAVAMEAVLIERLDQRSGVDPVLSPLWQELIASEDSAIGESAMKALAAQSRFMQLQRRMQHPVSELPPDTLERVLRIWVRATPVEQEPDVMDAMRVLKAEYDEAATRVGLLQQLVSKLRAATIAALELEHAGLALFATALSRLTDQPRDRAILACHDGQGARLALSLRGAGQDGAAIERQFQILEPAELLPAGIGDLPVDTARTILDSSFPDYRFEAPN